MWCGAQELGSETSYYCDSAVVQWLWAAGRRQLFLEAEGRQQGRQSVLVPRQGRRGLCCLGQSSCDTSLPPPHPTGTRGERTEHREQRDTEITSTADTETWTAKPKLRNLPHREVHAADRHHEPWSSEEVEGERDWKLWSRCRLGYVCLRIPEWVFRDTFVLTFWAHGAAHTGQGAETMRWL